MSVLDSFFGRGFKAAKCKTLLKLTIPRIKLLRNRREIQIKQMRRDIAKLLETGQEATARIRVENIIRETNMMAAQEILELFSELIAVRLLIIETQRECPLDLKEAVSSVCFAAPRCADLPELQQVRMLFALKYGKEFISAATELMPECGVNRQLIELLSVQAPSPEAKLKLLKEIAEEHKLDWNPAASETELLKPCEDLLNGLTQFIGGSKLPLPKGKHKETSESAPAQVYNEQPDSDTEFDPSDYPEVPNLPLQHSVNAASAPEIVPPKSATPQYPGNNQESSENAASEPHVEPQRVLQERSKAISVDDNKQFLPFITPPSLSIASFYSTQTSLPSSASFSARYSPPSSPPISARCSSPPPSVPFTATQISLPQSLSGTKSDANVDFQDVLSAVQAAAESAEQAAAAARSAASLAQVKIAEHTKKKIDEASDNNCDYPFSTNIFHQSATPELPQLFHQNSLNDSCGISHSTYLEDHLGSEGLNLPPLDTLKVGFDLSPAYDHVLEDEPAHHQPQRLPSMNDDPYFSYPNLFTSQNSKLGSGIHP